MEIGNLLFGHSRGEYKLENRDLVNCKDWQELLYVCECDSYGCTEDFSHETERGGYENDLFCINPYYWGEDKNLMEMPNFLYKPTGFEIRWYKYPFRDSYMNQNLTDRQIKVIWKKCAEYVKNCF